MNGAIESLSIPMHEFSVAQSIIDSINEDARVKNAKTVSEISIDVGELMQLDTSFLRHALKILRMGALSDAKLRIHIVKAKFSCRRCSYVWTMTEAKKQLSEVPEQLMVREPDSRELPLHFLPYLYPAFLHCVKCGSSDVSVTQGKDIRVRKLVLQ